MDASPVAHLALSGAKSLRLVHLLNIAPALNVSLQEDHGLLGLGEALDLVCHDQGNLGDAINSVT